MTTISSISGYAHLIFHERKKTVHEERECFEQYFLCSLFYKKIANTTYVNAKSITSKFFF